VTDMDSTIDLQFVEYIVKSLVGKPEQVKIERTIDEKGVLLELTVDPEDLGRVIGKRGATAQSLRTLLRALGTKNDARYNLKIVDNGAPRPDTGVAAVQSESDNKRVSASDDAPATSSAAATPANDAWTTAAAPATSTTTSDDDDHSSVVSKARKDLADLDDLDI
jgi:uncharacterized protein